MHGAVGFGAADAVMVNDLQQIGLIHAFHGLAHLVVVHHDHLLAVQVHHVAARNHAHVAAIGIQHGEIAIAHAGHDLAGLLYRGVGGEIDQPLFGHVKSDGGCLADHLACHIGAVGSGKHHHALFFGQHTHRARQLGVGTHNNAACLHFDRGQLAFAAVGHDHDIALAHGALHCLGIARAHNDAPLGVFVFHAAHHYTGFKRFHDIFVAGMGFAEHIRVQTIHIGRGDILHRDHALQVIFIVQNAQRIDFFIAHGHPCTAQGHIPLHAFHFADIHITDLGADIHQQARHRHLKAVQYKFGFTVQVSGTAGHAFLVALQLIFQVGIGNGCANRVRIRMLMADHMDMVTVEFRFHRYDLLLFR